MDESKTFYIELKELRESKDYSLDEISDFTKIDIKYLIAIEEGEFSSLSNVYMRLFLRSYCKYIGADSQKALSDYEFYTLGKKPSQSKSFSIKEPIKRENNEADIFETDLNLSQISPSKVRGIIVTIIVIVICFLLVNNIAKKQEGDESDLLDNNNISEKIVVVDEVIYKPIPNEKILSNLEFQSTNFLNDNSIILPDLPPYIFTIKILTKTKINIDNDSIITNKVVTPGEDLSFDVKNEIRFDFWDTTHIQCYLNGTSLSNFFGNKNQSIRGSFEINTQRLYYKIYNQINY